MRRLFSVLFLAAAFFAGCEATDPFGSDPPIGPGVPPSDPPANHLEAVPLTDLVRDDGVADLYLGFEGGLYFGTNEIPPAHAAFGAESARRIEPLDVDGNPDPNGSIVLLAIGMSNVSQEWCQQAPGPSTHVSTPCNPWSFMGRMTGDDRVNSRIVFANGAQGGSANDAWVDPDAQDYRHVRAKVLRHYGVSEAQVQVVWTKAALSNDYFPDTRPSLPDGNAEAFVDLEILGDHLRALKVRYPNLRLVFLSSRTNAALASEFSVSPEPFAYESGFAAKWLIEAQISQRETGYVNERAGDLVSGDLPFISWGPYLWTYNDRPRRDGLQWPAEFVEGGGVHPSDDGEQIVGDHLEEFFTTSPFASCWFLAGLSCQ